ncbi:iron ABC transporter ATP-binding protein/permease IrtB [Mycobacterium tuberculosis variant bovis BCG]|nr:iron ABC transporter ATP-binding protein/permease IrtB [Mycobacterium tuberculosis variant bovis BCG]AMC72607.1 iron ABC transporter ATP-binding protein/permease IrtB [Mycobacterium tuberculosis]
MIRTWIALVPNDHRARLIGFALLAFCSVVARAVGTVLLVPLMAALFGEAPQRAWLWLGWLSAATVAGWVLDAVTARIGIELGFAVLNHTQHDVADRLPVVRLDWFTAENTATARQAIAATGPELVGLVVNLVTPLTSAILLPAVIALALLPISWQLGVAALAGVPLLLGRCGPPQPLRGVPIPQQTKPIPRSPNGLSSSLGLNRHCGPPGASSRLEVWSATLWPASTPRRCGCWACRYRASCCSASPANWL